MLILMANLQVISSQCPINKLLLNDFPKTGMLSKKLPYNEVKWPTNFVNQDMNLLTATKVYAKYNRHVRKD